MAVLKLKSKTSFKSSKVPTDELDELSFI